MNDKKYLNIIAHYEDCLEKHGDNHMGVDWPKKEDVNTRYRVMLDLIRSDKTTGEITLLDFGCGASHLYEYILQYQIPNITYSGLDLSEKFISLSKGKFPDNQFYCLDIIEDPNGIPNFDYILMNGVFTEKRELSFDEMFEYLKTMLTITFQKANKGIAFNVMSKAVDWERNDLFHLSLDTLADFLTKNLSRHFVIRNDYGLYEYTVYLYK
jgi:SAM-dependent methyltransferase